MLAAYTENPNFDDPLAALIVGERPEPVAAEGSVKVKVEALDSSQAASLAIFSAVP